MTLAKRLRQKQAAITELWLEKTLGTYPPDASVFFRRQKNQFANPVGQTLSAGIENAFDSLLAGAPAEKLCEQLDEIIKIRAVQEFTPSRAVIFVFMLKEAIREELGKDLDDPRLAKELLRFEHQIDQMALFAFDLFVKAVKKTYELRVNEIKRQVSTLMKRSGYFSGDSDLKSDPPGDTN